MSKILIVDDSHTIRRSAEIFLRQGGHELIFANDGFEALSCVVQSQPDIIFCDILMPKLDGYQTCSIIRRNQRFAKTAIILLSSKDSVFDKVKGRMVGCNDYLTKPFTKEQLISSVKNYTE